MNIQIAQKLKASDLDDKSLLQMFIKLRDRREQRKAAFNADDATDKDKQSRIEVEFLRRFNERGTDNTSSREHGTAYRSTRSSVTIADWDIFLTHVKKNEAWELLEHRANKKNAQEYTEVHGEIVPGTKYSETQVVNFRRK